MASLRRLERRGGFATLLPPRRRWMWEGSLRVETRMLAREMAAYLMVGGEDGGRRRRLTVWFARRWCWWCLGPVENVTSKGRRSLWW